MDFTKYDTWVTWTYGLFIGIAWGWANPWFGLAVASLIGLGTALTWLIRTGGDA